MSVGSRDSYLKSLPAVGPFLDRVARYRLKGFHREERNGDGNELDVVATYSILPPWGPGTPKWVRDATPNNSDKSFTVPAGKAWMLLSEYAEIATDASIGNRVLMELIRDASGATVECATKTANIAASNTGNLYVDRSGSAVVSVSVGQYTPLLSGANAGVSVHIAAGVRLLPSGYSVRIYDSAAIAAAADDLTVVLHYVEYDA